MNNLLARTIQAHGGLENWEKNSKVIARAKITGLTWLRKGHPDLLKDTIVQVDTKEQLVHYIPINQGLYKLFEPHRVADIMLGDDIILEELFNPRQSFEGHTMQSTWTELQTVYFAGYAIWTYFNSPFIFANPDYEVKEIEPWQENGEEWKRLQFTFPDYTATHNPTQIFYIDKTGLIRRHDYNVEISGNTGGAHYLYDYQEVQGFKIVTKRKVFVRQADNTSSQPEPILVEINLSEIEFRQ